VYRRFWWKVLVEGSDGRFWWKVLVEGSDWRFWYGGW